MSDRRLHNWPNRQASRFVRAGGLVWHVQIMGAGPPILLVHGTGAATHSWRGLAPLLAANFTVIAPDLPGHGFTEAPATSRLSLPGMARSLQTLLWSLGMSPAVAVGHSAGAAILMRMGLDGQIAPRALVALNGAMLPLGGVAGQMFSPMAKLLAGLPGLPSLFAWRARDPRVVEQLLAGTGSRLDPEGVALYARVVGEPGHAAAALGMMAQWNLAPLVADLPRLAVPLLLLAGTNDRTVPPSQSEATRTLVPGARLVLCPGLGHLAHEEAPAATAAHITGFAREVGVLA
ncbi:MAG: alpha/beta fold hydrolase [Acetobacteraceae bacterium]